MGISPYDPNNDTDALTEDVDAPTATAVRRQVQREGGRAHDFSHTDREVVMDLPGKISGKLKPTAVPLCICGRSTVVSLPQRDAAGFAAPGAELVRACIQCDALPNWPRYNADEPVAA